MRIKSDFHDYYDSVQKLGQDKDLVWVRKRRREELAFTWKLPWYQQQWSRNEVWAIIGFCGKIYGVIRIVKTIRNYPEEEVFYCHGIDAVDITLKRILTEEDYTAYCCDRPDNRHKRLTWARQRRNVVNFFTECEQGRNAFEGQFITAQSPVFIKEVCGKKQTLTWNASLKEWEFFRVMEPYTAFQELQMYWAGLAKPEKPIPIVSDKDMALAKGFDHWSFRKEPSKVISPKTKEGDKK